MTTDDSGAAPRDTDTTDTAAGDTSGGHVKSGGTGTHAAAHDAPATTDNPDDDTIAIRLEQLILGADRRYTPFQAARSAGVSMDLAARFWRAMGFADIGQVKALTEADVLALRRLAGLVEAGLLSEAMAVQVARSTGQTTARLADWQIDSFLEGLTEPQDTGLTRTEITYPLVELLLPELEEFLVYVWRRQLAAATGRVVQAQDDAEMIDRRLAVGFADLVGFTRLTRRLEEEELGELVEAFETTAADLVAAHGGRLIKTLGDEVLFSADDAGTAAEIGLRLIETMTHDETMPELRVGIAFGTVTTRMGDVFGTTVNLASRLTSIAPKDTVLVDEAFAEELGRTGDAPVSEADAAAAEKAAKEGADGTPPPSYRFALQPMWQRPVRGLGVVEPWLLSRRG
ncbi:adenylate/guanylate cyclase domain-containing protein [Streptomyces kasugaensis]|uniref:Adenylate/guanylate cyclase domain-containing protein n=1 Tax=Streptomyces kasugaensis TaxID=1946 RepID=A0A4Q9HQJ4_STRKA|nr:adenylate/guanylate cyclase domain-containing protein [Streptomyces kasugaensis]TBO57214.1 adenylate/guanylate cyclase domain-containing protein [Streptomyces kasugaensis]